MCGMFAGHFLFVITFCTWTVVCFLTRAQITVLLMLCYSNYLGTCGPLCIVEQVNGHLENTAYRPWT